jgi:hypothetical protein
MRTCPGCGVDEHRWIDGKGIERVNLEPTTNRCVDCLSAAFTTFTSRRDPPADLPFDSRAAAARNDE